MGTIPMPSLGMGNQNPTMGAQPPAANGGGVGTPGGGVFNIGPGGTPIPGGPAQSSGTAQPTNAFSAVGAEGQTNGATPIPVPHANVAGAGSAPVSTIAPANSTSLGVGNAGLPGTGTGTSSNSNLKGLKSAEDNLYGSGFGNTLTNLLGSIGGVDSASLQNYVTSLQPAEAQAQATTNAALGAGGVAANSSVAAIADSNLQAQETSAIAGESAQLQQSGQALEASILTSQEKDMAQAQADSSPWAIFGDIVGGIGGLAKAAGGVIGDIGAIQNLGS